jgi:hypothetical protein
MGRFWAVSWFILAVLVGLIGPTINPNIGYLMSIFIGIGTGWFVSGVIANGLRPGLSVAERAGIGGISGAVLGCGTGLILGWGGGGFGGPSIVVWVIGLAITGAVTGAICGVIFWSESLLDMFENPRSTIRALKILEAMGDSKAVPILVGGLQHHKNSKVRATCITTLLPYDLDEEALRSIIAALDDRSAQVRHAAASFFGLRGTQGRPVQSALKPLVNATTKENPSVEGDKLAEMTAQISFKLAAASAIKATVGAQKIVIDFEKQPIDLEGFKRSMELLESSSEDPILREDAKKYLRHLFGLK